MKNHGLWMMLCCALPLLLIFILPTFGVRNDAALFIFIILIFGCHILMMGGHHRKHNKGNNEKEAKYGYH